MTDTDKNMDNFERNTLIDKPNKNLVVKFVGIMKIPSDL